MFETFNYGRLPVSIKIRQNFLVMKYHANFLSSHSIAFILITFFKNEHNQSLNHDWDEIVSKFELESKIRDQCCKDTDQPLRKIFDKVSNDDPSAYSVSFGKMESSMYYQRRKNQPKLPKSVDDLLQPLESAIGKIGGLPFFEDLDIHQMVVS